MELERRATRRSRRTCTCRRPQAMDVCNVWTSRHCRQSPMTDLMWRQRSLSFFSPCRSRAWHPAPCLSPLHLFFFLLVVPTVFRPLSLSTLHSPPLLSLHSLPLIPSSDLSVFFFALYFCHHKQKNVRTAVSPSSRRHTPRAIRQSTLPSRGQEQAKEIPWVYRRGILRSHQAGCWTPLW